MWTEDDLIGETEWTRSYANKDKTGFFDKSKFLDGSVSISLPELMARWPAWSDYERHDFCSAFTCASQNDSADIYRFLAADETDLIRSTIALCVAQFLPADESIPLLNSWANAAPIGQRSNYVQAIAATDAPEALPLVKQQFELLCEHPQLLDGAQWYNEIAMDLVWCFRHLLELGTQPADLRPVYERLSQHPCDRIRQQVGRWLADSFGERPSKEA